MTLKLIPVIEIVYCNQGVTTPDKYPYWNYPDLWDKYNAETYKKAGFKDSLKPYLAGSSFYRLKDISIDNLVKLTKDHTEQMRLGKYKREETSGFSGGYVLSIDEQDIYFPQCCGDLSDIQYWDKLAKDKDNTFYQGHPEPEVTIKGDIVTFDFTVEEFDEHFSPTPAENIIIFDIPSLKQAIEIVMPELEEFSNRLKQINIQEDLGIDDIDRLLVWGDD